jgi:putative NADPH-quinone reductase
MDCIVDNVGAVRVLLLHAHPLEDSYSAALRDRAVEALDGDDHDITVARLGAGDDAGPDRDELTDISALVLVYPTWWGSQPAPLLGWIQRVIGPWIDERGRQLEESPLGSVEKLIVITTHGSSRWINGLQGEPGRHLLKRSVLPLCAPGVEFRWISLYKLDLLEPSDLVAFIDRVGRELTGLTSAGAPA